MSPSAALGQPWPQPPPPRTGPSVRQAVIEIWPDKGWCEGTAGPEGVRAQAGLAGRLALGYGVDDRRWPDKAKELTDEVVRTST
ncbi:unnamed protein product [Cutaneotrichosporon oleaginosum]